MVINTQKYVNTSPCYHTRLSAPGSKHGHRCTRALRLTDTVCMSARPAPADQLNTTCRIPFRNIVWDHLESTRCSDLSVRPLINLQVQRRAGAHGLPKSLANHQSSPPGDSKAFAGASTRTNLLGMMVFLCEGSTRQDFPPFIVDRYSTLTECSEVSCHWALNHCCLSAFAP